MRAGETEKSISVKDPALFEVIEKTVSALSLAGPIDMDISGLTANIIFPKSIRGLAAAIPTHGTAT